jgi:hypothetical protein
MITHKEEKETKYLLFEKQTHDDRKTYTVNVKNKSGLLLGEIMWFSQWRRYVFYPSKNKLFKIYSQFNGGKKMSEITHEEAQKCIVELTSDKELNEIEIGDFQNILRTYFSQQEELTTAVKRYFELKSKGITTEAEALEHRELLSKLYEMVGIK